MIGICNLSNIPLRSKPNSRSEMVSQILFGETFDILEGDKEWTKIFTHLDSYSGWISSKQFEILNDEISTNTVATGFPYNEALFSYGKILIPPGANLPNINDSCISINNTLFELNDKNKTNTFIDLSSIALQYLNVPYLWGGRTPSGIDCSGFTQIVFKQLGINLLRDANQQAESGKTIILLDDVCEGDLAFFDNEEGKIIHVGIMLDKNKIIHASGKVRIDGINNKGIINTDTNEISHKLRIIKRIF